MVTSGRNSHSGLTLILEKKNKDSFCPSIGRLPGTEPVLAESRSISISCVRVSQDATYDNSCVRPRVAASLRGREDLAVIQGKWAIAFFVSAFLLCHGNGRAVWNKGKGVFKTRRFLPVEKKKRMFYSTTEVSVFIVGHWECRSSTRILDRFEFTRHERFFSFRS